MKKWKLWTGLAVVFASGIIIGVVGTLVYVKTQIFNVVQGDYTQVNRMILERLDKELDFSPEQEIHVAAAIAKASREVQKARRQLVPMGEIIVARCIAQMKKVLSEKQARGLDGIAARVKRDRDRWLKIKENHEKQDKKEP